MDDDATPLEDRLRSALATGIEAIEAGAGAPAPDPTDLARRRIAHHRRQVAGRAVAVVAVALAAAVGGWALGRDGGDVEQVTSPGSATTTVTTAAGRSDGVEVADGGDPPVVAPVGQVLMGGGMESDAAALASLPARIRPAEDPWYEGPLLPSVPLFTRTVDDGTTLSVAGNRYDPAIYELPTFWEPPPQCFPSGDVVVDALGGAGEGQVATTRWDAVSTGSMLVGAGVVGPAEDRWVAVAQGPAGTATIRVTFPGGASDEMTPVDGVAVLTAPTVAGLELQADDPLADPPPPDLLAVALDADGEELARWEGPWSGVERGTRTPRLPVAPFRRPDCAPPTSLPPPGAEQPADPAAAEAAVRATWDGAFGRPAATPVAEQLAVVDDPRGLAEALEAVRAQNAPLDLGDDTLRIDGVVFADAGRAHVQYTHDPGFEQGLPTPGLFAELVLADGRWQVTRLSVCRLITFGGGACPPIG